MKFTAAALLLAVAPLSLAKAVHNVYPVAARAPKVYNKAKNNKNSNAKAATATATEIIIVWNNGGGGAATSTITQAVTVTQTITAGAEAATTVGTNTVAAGATTVVSGVGATHTVTVGGTAGLVYTPSSISAAIGDMVVFTFLATNHTVTQSGFTTPCDTLAGGMDSGFVPNINSSTVPPPQVGMQVMVDTPLWFYCKQGNHCGEGMVFSINPTANKTQDDFVANAKAEKGTAGSAAAGTAATATSSSTATATSNIATGTGTLTADNQCVCAAVCGAGSFPVVAAQGLDAFGGTPGSLPANFAEVS
ncbi:hypothetical protein BX600DRAFT_125360 [Xylariales sp. PMI_506]|nr:hypothetical protein BX600DRAFT_125360 [Xylariales sp. PMI_506]